MTTYTGNTLILTPGAENALRELIHPDRIKGRRVSHVSWNNPPSFRDWADFIREECKSTHSSPRKMAIKLEKPLIFLRIATGEHTFPDFCVAGVLRDLYPTGEWQVVYDQGPSDDTP